MKHRFTNEERASRAERALERGLISPADRIAPPVAREPAAEYRVAA